MSKKLEKPVHPGTFIREHVIPAGMYVKDAAERLGVGRPALSDLLNGKSSLSPNMAVRLEKSFGVDRQKLLDIQAEFDRYNRQGEEKSIAARTYVPSFLTIKAGQIEDWAEKNIAARHLLAVLLRKLIHSTGDELRQVDFPGYDNAERRGWDGWVESDTATPWIPEGKSGWEFGTDKDPKRKAERDYANRSSVPPDEKAECTFVFVTPRNWPGKTDWARSKQAEGDWKAVRAFDASDLEQWLEESIPAQMWLAEQLNMPEISKFETLEQSWRRWEAVSYPKMTPKMFEPSIIAYRDTFKEWLEKLSEKPFVVAADSIDEALAFLACLFQDKNISAHWKELAAVFKSAETLRTLADSSSPFIPIVYTEEAARELATVYHRLHCIIVRPRNAINSEPDIALNLLNHDAFEEALAEMGIEDDEAKRLARESGRSPTILRRRLSPEAIRKPPWSQDAEVAKSLIPMTLIGAWHAKSKADHEVVSTLSDRPYQETEVEIVRLLQFDDCPVWSVGEYRGVSSKIDALFALNKYVTEKSLDNFFFLAEYVLSEKDPALDLPEDKRWAAGLYGKIRNHSAALREGICETLVILSVHGNNLFQERLGMDVESHVSSLIRGLLTPLTLDKLISHNRDLSHYAEAAPDEFLKLLEEDLRQSQPIVIGLLKPVESGPFSSPSRTGLLSALECLAWKHLGRVSPILAQLSRIVINDNWLNKPISSLYATYWSSCPQTAASLKERIMALERLTKCFPDIGWQICIAQLQTSSSIIDSYRPRWRSDASGAGRWVTERECHEFTRKAFDLVLAWPEHDQKTLGDLVERLPVIPEEYQTLVWDLIDTWADSETDEKAKAGLRERIRTFAFTRRGRRHGLKDATKDRAHMAYEKLQLRDSIVRHTWLFAQPWVEPSSDEIEDEDFDHIKREEKIRTLRIIAMEEIWMQCGFEGVKALLSRSNAPTAIGVSLCLNITTMNARTDFLRQCLSTTGDLERKVDGCIQGFLMSVGDDSLDALLSAVCKDMDTDRIVRLFRCAPFKQDTWRLLDQYSQEVQDRYWQEVQPQWNRDSEAELIDIIDHLLKAQRPRAAFQTVCWDWPKVETSRLKRLLRAVATVDDEPEDWYILDAHSLSEALDSLDGRTGVSPNEMAQLEFMFIMALEHSNHGIPNLERQIAESPALFVQVLALAFKRNDDGQDPPEWQIEDLERRAELASAAYSLLKRVGRIPGTGPDDKVNAEELLDWIAEVRQLCAEHGRVESGDQKIGELLSKAHPEEDGGWPCLPVCEAMERFASQQIGDGFKIGVINRRGVHSRGIYEGGAQERELAAKYRNWAKQRAFNYPYVSSVLERIAADYDREAKREDTEAEISKRLGLHMRWNRGGG